MEHRPLFPDSDEQALAGSDGGSLSTLDGEGGPVVDQTPDDGEGADGDGDGATTEEVAH